MSFLALSRAVDDKPALAAPPDRPCLAALPTLMTELLRSLSMGSLQPTLCDDCPHKMVDFSCMTQVVKWWVPEVGRILKTETVV